MQTRKAASVLPDPVGAAISVCRPAAISAQPPACGGVGPSGNRLANQVRTAGCRIPITGLQYRSPRSMSPPGRGRAGPDRARLSRWPVRRGRRVDGGRDPFLAWEPTMGADARRSTGGAAAGDRPPVTAAPACCIAGGGPAGMMLGLLLARAGVRVRVLEKHSDFLRDFRGDTIHPSTLQVLE